ncbi:SDR family oxidoreductase [Spongiibacter taiwanensis]|uniref:SDR family oxidoreductase n=1 Tax=Spongiibacter taiwanensis TaxID=1748242 RepID=UPI0020360994|nr:SDR family oxidoreductase [Spongiibacter taiwanensis]USA41662.1 SDR family oxidoreductase [Spongiibacter taiwanensis]
MMTKRVFVTGGASGLGLALARCFARGGYRVCIGDIQSARGQSSLAELATLVTPDCDPHYLHCDVTDDASIAEAAAWLLANWGGVDVVVNNAGVAAAGSIEGLSVQDWHWLLNINLLGVVRGCQVFAPLLQTQGGGHIVNVASLAGLVHPPSMSAYCASKAAVVALSESLGYELAPVGVSVSVVCPSFFRTNLAESVRASDESARLMTEKLVNRAKHSADEVAAVIYKGIQRRDPLIIPQAEARAIFRLKRWLPGGLYRRLMLSRTAGMAARRG